MPNSKKLFIFLSLLLLVLGVFLTSVYCSPVKENKLITQDTFSVAPNDYQSIQLNQSLYPTGYFHVQINADNGTIHVFSNSCNSTKIASDGRSIDIWNSQFYSNYLLFNGTTGNFSLGVVTNTQFSTYLFFFNPNSSSEEVSYDVTFEWSYYNYVALAVGITLSQLAIIALIGLLIKTKLNSSREALFKRHAPANIEHWINFAEGALMSTSLIWIFICITVAFFTRTWYSLAGLFILIVPFGLRNRSFPTQFRLWKKIPDNIQRIKRLLVPILGFGVACWIFDILTTFIGLDIVQTQYINAENFYSIFNYSELNPLGWPLGIVVGLIAYIPSGLSVYYLLTKMKTKLSVKIACAITVLTVGLGLMNLVAGLNNISILIQYFNVNNSVSLFLWFNILLTISAINVVTYKKFSFYKTVPLPE